MFTDKIKRLVERVPKSPSFWTTIVPTRRSINKLLRSRTLVPLLAEIYALPEPVRCDLLRAGSNHNYKVQAGQEAYVLRVYLNNQYYIDGPDDFRYELDLLHFLSSQGIPVATPVANVSGERLSTCEIHGETRHMALFEFAAGKNVVNLQDHHAYLLGETVGRAHQAADQFQSPYPRYHLDLRYLLEEPLERLGQQLQEHKMGDLSFFRPRAQALRRAAESLPKTPPAYGLIHADLNLSNVLYHPDAGFTLLDFEHAAFGWRAYDLGIFGDILKGHRWTACLKGYESVRPLSAAEKEFFTSFSAFRTLWDIGDILNMMSSWGEKPSEKFLRECLARVQRLAREPLPA